MHDFLNVLHVSQSLRRLFKLGISDHTADACDLHRQRCFTFHGRCTRPSATVPSPLPLWESGTCYHRQSRHCHHCRLSCPWYLHRLFRAQRWHVQLSQFYRRRKRNIWTGPVNHTTVIHIIHCSCYNYKILDHLLTASAYEFTKDY